MADPFFSESSTLQETITKSAKSVKYHQLDPASVITTGNHLLVYNIASQTLEDYEEKFLQIEPPQAVGRSTRCQVTFKGAPLRLLTPPLKAPFGVSKYDDRFSVDLELTSPHTAANDPKHDLFHVLRLIDLQAYSALQKNQSEWLPQTVSKYQKDELWKIFSPATRLRESKDVVYAPKLSAKFRKQSYLFDYAGSQTVSPQGYETTLDLEGATTTTSQTWMKALVECSGLWITRDAVYLSYFVVQARLVDAPPMEEDLPSQARPIKQLE